MMSHNYRAVQAFFASKSDSKRVDPDTIKLAADEDMINLDGIADALGCAPHELQTVFDDLKPDYK
jgi:hypothetical protein